MTHNHPETQERRTGSSTWWTPRRTKMAGLCGFAGGLGSLGVISPLIGHTGAEIGLGAVSLLYPVWHLLLAVALLAADAKYGSRYGRSGRTVSLFLALSLLCYAALTLVLLMIRTVPGDVLLFGVLTGGLYMAIRLFGSCYGIVLWQRADSDRRTRADRLTAALFAISFPAVFVLGLLTQFGFPSELIDSPFYLAFIALSYTLWTNDTDASQANSGENL
ncbi:hypothetical protein [Natrialba sp. PRR66]|uniref:hypothetical protein n=1 Tax=Natrialba sp. PRR66 TaxID=3098146 RepID=UPI002B1DF61C|nr:hypothetical protein [Natrialba sp. PRR66]